MGKIAGVVVGIVLGLSAVVSAAEIVSVSKVVPNSRCSLATQDYVSAEAMEVVFESEGARYRLVMPAWDARTGRAWSKEGLRAYVDGNEEALRGKAARMAEPDMGLFDGAAMEDRAAAGYVEALLEQINELRARLELGAVERADLEYEARGKMEANLVDAVAVEGVK